MLTHWGILRNSRLQRGVWGDELLVGPGEGGEGVEIWCGGRDKNVPLRSCEHTMAAIPRAELNVADGMGHYGPSSTFSVSACAARTLNVTGQSRVALSLQKAHLGAVCGPCQEERSLTFVQKRSSQASSSLSS